MRIRNRILVLVLASFAGALSLVLTGLHGLVSLGDAQRTLVDDHFERIVSDDLVRLQELYGSIELLLNGDRDSYQAMLAQSQAGDYATDATRRTELREWFDENVGQARERVAAGAADIADEGVRKALLKEFGTKFDAWLRLAVKGFGVERGDESAETSTRRTAAHDAFGAMRDVIDRMQMQQEKTIEALLASVGTRRTEALQVAAVSGDKVEALVRWFVSIGATMVVFVAVMGFVLSRGILRQLAHLMRGFHDLAQGRGDLTRRMDETRRDEFGTLAKEFNAFNAKLERLVIEIRMSSGQIHQGSLHLSTTSSNLAQSATEQAGNLQEMTVGANHLAERTRENAESARQAAGLADSARERADVGLERTGRMMDAMKMLNDSSAEIASIVQVIDEIAFNTNLLALNASVEAARAGDAGKGFAVVAEEVRMLAQRTTSAASDIAARIGQSVQRTDTASQVANGVHDALGEIVDAACRTTALLTEIVTGSDEQAAHLAEFDQSLLALDDVTQRNAASSEELAAAAQQTSAQVMTLDSLVKMFRVSGEGELEAAAADDAHGRGDDY